MVYHSPYQAAKVFNQLADDDDKLYSFRVRYWGAFFYAKSYGTWLKSDDDLPQLTDTANAWVLTDDYGLGQLKEKGFEFEIIKTFPHKSITGQSLKFMAAKDKSQRVQNYHLLHMKQQGLL